MFCDCDKKINELEYKIEEAQKSINKIVEYQTNLDSTYRKSMSLFDQLVKRLDSLKENVEFYRFLQYWVAKDKDE